MINNVTSHVISKSSIAKEKKEAVEEDDEEQFTYLSAVHR